MSVRSVRSADPDQEPIHGGAQPRGAQLVFVELETHPVAMLFPDLDPADFDALVEDIRQHGVKEPILIHQGMILDGRHRYEACRRLGRPCPAVEWDGDHPWFEVQSRNLVRRHLAKEQIYAIQLLAAVRFPQLAARFGAVRGEAALRRTQAEGRRRGDKALLRPQGRRRHESESASVIGAAFGVSATTVKRVDRLARLAPQLLPKVANGELSAKKALLEVVVKGQFVSTPVGRALPGGEGTFILSEATSRFRMMVKAEWARWPVEYRNDFLRAVSRQVQELIYEHTTSTRPWHRASSGGKQMVIVPSNEAGTR